MLSIGFRPGIYRAIALKTQIRNSRKELSYTDLQDSGLDYVYDFTIVMI